MDLPKHTLPEHLYRYGSLDSNHEDRTEHLFLKGELYIPHPSKFNDPFDVRVNFLNHGTLSEKEKFIEKIHTYQDISITPNYISRRANSLFKGKSENEITKTIQELMQEVVEDTGILSLSENSRSLLMWAHYSDGHRGFCMEFDPVTIFPEGQYENPPLPVRVEYKLDYLNVNIFTGLPEQLYSFLFLTKSRDWEYEREWRVIVDPVANLHNKWNKFNPDALTRVILGCVIEPAVEEKILGWINEGPTNPKIVRARKSQSQFKLEIPEE